MEKVCISCGETKPLTDYYKHPQMKDGRLGKCKACCKAQAVAHRNANIEAARARDRARGMAPHRVEARKAYLQTPEGKATRARAAKASDARRPLRKAANVILSNAVKRGAVKAWPVCALPECTEQKVEGHHPDYSAPLDVVWLCNKHHREAHRLLTRLLKF